MSGKSLDEMTLEEIEDRLDELQERKEDARELRQLIGDVREGMAEIDGHHLVGEKLAAEINLLKTMVGWVTHHDLHVEKAVRYEREQLRRRKFELERQEETDGEELVTDGGRVEADREPRDGESYDGNGGIRPVPSDVAPAPEPETEPDHPEPTAETAYTKLSTKVKRGTGTRDQDTVKVTTRHPDPRTAAVQHQQAIESVRSAANAARTIQPDGDDNPHPDAGGEGA